MTLADLLAGLRSEAEAETALLEAETREQANRIRAAARAEASVLREQIVLAAEDDIRKEADRRRAAARLAVAASVRVAREELFLDFRTTVSRRLDELREDERYPAVLRALLEESLAALPDATSLRVDPRDERLARQLLAERGVKLELAASLKTAGGLELADGRERVVRNTVEERVANAEAVLRGLLANDPSDEARR
jgi:V/A-type H+/Na+-transporting ATPase subunit E